MLTEPCCQAFERVRAELLWYQPSATSPAQRNPIEREGAIDELKVQIEAKRRPLSSALEHRAGRSVQGAR